MNNYHIIKVKNVFNNRDLMPMVKIESELFQQSKRIYYNNDAGSGQPALDTAIAYLNSLVYLVENEEGKKETKGFNIIGKGEGKDHYYLISDTFQPIK